MKDVGAGIDVEKDATPVLENNTVELAHSESEKTWAYGNFAYTMFGDPIVPTGENAPND